MRSQGEEELNVDELDREANLEEGARIEHDLVAESGQVDMAAEDFREANTRQVLDQALIIMTEDYAISLSPKERLPAKVLTYARAWCGCYMGIAKKIFLN